MTKYKYQDKKDPKKRLSINADNPWAARWILKGVISQAGLTSDDKDFKLIH